MTSAPAPSSKGPPAISQTLGKIFLAALEADLAENGEKVITALRTERPHDYVRIVVGLLPTNVPNDASHKRRGLTAERLRELLRYAPDTGLFYWRKARGGGPRGREAGTRFGKGYCVIVIDYVPYYAHRLAWLYVHGKHPSGDIDHINGDRSDNRIANLRQCTRRENMRNTRSRNPTGFKGVYRRKTRRPRWGARISVNKKTIYLGSYGSPEEAAAAYGAADRRYNGEFARTSTLSDQRASTSSAPDHPSSSSTITGDGCEKSLKRAQRGRTLK